MSTITFLGDVWLPFPVRSQLPLTGDFILNLESPITRRTTRTPGKICLKAEENHLLQTFGRWPSAVCLANNHIMDYGEAGFSDTLQHLEDSGIAHFGAGTLKQNCNNPLLLDLGGTRVAVMGYVCPTTHPILAEGDAPGVMPADLATILKDMETARRLGARRCIVSLHWGVEEVHFPRWEDMQLAKSVLDGGADLIIGHHAHAVQPCVQHGGKQVFFGLGNLVFPELPIQVFPYAFRRRPAWNRRSYVVRADMDTMETKVSGAFFDGTVVYQTDPPRIGFRSSWLGSDQRSYSRIYAAHLRRMRLRERLYRFIDCRRHLPGAD